MNAECRILYLLKMFIRMTDSEHFMSMTTIMTYLSNGGYGVGKRTIKEEMDALTYMGFDIEYIHSKGYHLKKTPFFSCYSENACRCNCFVPLPNR